MAGLPKYDYEELEREYVSGEMSIRALAESHGIKGFSSVADQARKREWERKRAQFRESASAKQIEAMATSRALRIAAIHDDFLIALQASIHRWAMNMKSDTYILRPAEIATLAEVFMRLSGYVQVTGGEEQHTTVGQLNIFEGMEPEAFDGLIRALRPRAALARTVSPDPLPALEGPRTN